MSDDYNNLFTTPEWRRYAEQMVSSTVPAMKDSKLFVSMGPTGDDPDVRMATELGLALLLGKPLVFIVEPGQKLPPALVRVADKIIYGEIQHPNTRKQLKEALDEIVPEKET